MNENIIIAAFGAQRKTTVRPRYRYDTGQRLIIKTPNGLPDFYEVYFANEGGTAEAEPHLATAEGVMIPDSFFQSGAAILAWAHVYGESSEGTTIYEVKIPLHNRTRPANVEPDPEEKDIIAEVIAALNEQAEEIRQMATELEQSIQDADEATGNANAAARRISSIDMTVEMLEPTAEPTADVDMRDDGTGIALGIPKSNIAYGTFEVEDDMELVLNSPENFPDIEFSLSEDGMLEVNI